MEPGRRAFLTSLGVTFVGILLARCTPSDLLGTPTPSGEAGDWARLRQAWLSLRDLAQDARDIEKGEATRDRLCREHRAALDRLVERGSLNATVANDIDIAYGGAAYHIWRSNAPITCYLPAEGPQFVTRSNVRLATQSALLEEMAAKSQIEPATVDLARAAIERDMAFLSLSREDQQAIGDRAQREYRERPYPELDAIGLTVPPDCVQAAEVLVELLLGKK
jgi:hypothetical protein